MASKKLSIHVPPDSNPANIAATISTLAGEPELLFDSSNELLEYLLEQGIGSRTEIQSTASSMGILEKVEGKLRLSEDGFALSKMRDDARPDLMHFLMYTGWTKNNPTEFLQSWAYRTACDQYWTMGKVELSGDYLDRQVDEIINLAHSTFSQMGIGDFDEISFSRKSLKGIDNWLSAVQPSVIENKTTFTRRSFCPPELMIMAIGYVLQNEDNVLGIDILLTPEKREQISKICLLDSDSLDRNLDWTLPIFANIVSPGTTAGFYGRFIRLSRLPTLQDVVR